MPLQQKSAKTPRTLGRRARKRVSAGSHRCESRSLRARAFSRSEFAMEISASQCRGNSNTWESIALSPRRAPHGQRDSKFIAPLSAAS